MKSDILKWLTDWSGCNGGNIGNKENPSIWVCGLEYKGIWDKDNLYANIYKEKWENNPNFGLAELHLHLNNYHYPIYKLLDFIAGSNDYYPYKEFAENNQLFMQNSTSPYFQMNLYPIALENHKASCWLDDYNEITEFQGFDDYIKMCQKYRFPALLDKVKTYQPRLIICFGERYCHDFMLAFSDNDSEIYHIELNGLTLSYRENDNGTIVAVLPFPNKPNGLLKNFDIWVFGVFLRGLLNGK